MASVAVPHVGAMGWTILHGQVLMPEWSIHKGSCDYGYIWRNEPLGWDVAAMTDYHPDCSESCA